MANKSLFDRPFFTGFARYCFMALRPYLYKQTFQWINSADNLHTSFYTWVTITRADDAPCVLEWSWKAANSASLTLLWTLFYCLYAVEMLLAWICNQANSVWRDFLFNFGILSRASPRLYWCGGSEIWRAIFLGTGRQNDSFEQSFQMWYRVPVSAKFNGVRLSWGLAGDV